MPQLTIQDACQLALDHYKAGRLPAAADLCAKILAYTPEHAGVMRLLGLICHDLGRHEESVDWLSRSVALNPASAEAHYNLGVSLEAIGERDQAIAAYRAAVRVKPRYAAAYNNLGIALHDGGRFAGAIAAFGDAISLRPQHAEGYCNLANTLKAQGQLDQAIAAYQTAISLHPNYAQAHNNLGNALKIKGDIDGAIAAYRAALELQPHDAELHSNLGSALKDKGHLNDAITAYQRAIALQPHCAEFHANLAVALLIARRFKDGWREYEWRWQPAKVAGTMWDGSPLCGRTILVRAEQGFGDAIQFARYVPLLASGGKVIFQCPKELVRLMHRVEGMEGVQIIGRADRDNPPLPAFHVQVSLMSLPLLLGMPEPTDDLSQPYIRVESDLRRAWRSKMDCSDQLKVGIAWAGAPGHPSDARRSIPLRVFAPLLQSPADFYSLQVGDASVRNLEDSGLIDLSAEFTDFLDTAGLISQVDLVVSVDTSVAHLAAAMGKPTWVLVSHAPDWRWQLGCEESPWYASVKIFRQIRLGDWDEVIARITESLGREIDRAEKRTRRAA
jgi:tetratricopeptide (TPR) repeat protein